MDQDRVCETCGVRQPLTDQHFKPTEVGFSKRCLTCRKKAAKEEAKQDRRRRAAALAKVEADGVDFWLSQVKAGGSNIPHSAEVVERVVEYFGGTSGFSAMLVKQYYDAAPGGSTRSRLLETICRLISKNVDQGGVKRPLAMWSEDELEQELQTRFAAAVRVVQGEVVSDEAKRPKKKAPRGLPAPDTPVAPSLESVREGRTQEPAKRASRAKDRGAQALPPEPEPRSDPRLHGE
jgi:hypothetical protein